MIRVIDVETTGLEPPDAEICEVAAIDVVRAPDGSIRCETGFSTLVRPSRPIPPEVSAVHHITDADVSGAPSWERVRSQLIDPRVIAYCAHNAKFERLFIDVGAPPWIDTYKVATRLWPDAPNHKNQTLRYWLGIDLDREQARPPHRAGPDAYVTAHILVRALGLMTATEMGRISAQPALLPKLQFGKHFGVKFSDAPRDYLEWLSKQKDMDEDVVFTARTELSRRREAV